MSEAGTEHDLSITVALSYLVTWYTPGWWSESSHAYDYLAHGGEPYSKMPKAVVAASLDDTLAVVIDRAGEELGIAPGPDAPGSSLGKLSSMLFHVGFYRLSDEDGFDVQHSYQWPDRLPVADMQGNVTYHPWQEVTHRQLLVSAEVGLIEGDVRRPYICPSIPQGDIPGLAEVTKVAVETARAAYGALEAAGAHAGDVKDAAREHVDDAQRVAFVWTMWQLLKQRFRKKKTRKRAGRRKKKSPPR